MLRKALAFAATLCLSVATGCTMCCHPYDYCGPVYDCGRCMPSNARAGSILSGDSGVEAIPDAELSQRQAPRKTNVARSTSNRSASARPSSVRSPSSSPARTAANRTSSPAQRRTTGQAKATYGQNARFAVVNGRVEGIVEGRVQTGKVPGSEQILSVTERVVDSNTSPSKGAPEEDLVDAAPSTSATMTSTTSSDSQGWTARRTAP